MSGGAAGGEGSRRGLATKRRRLSVLWQSAPSSVRAVPCKLPSQPAPIQPLTLPMGCGSVVEVGKWPCQSRRPNKPRQPLCRSAVLGRHHGTSGWPCGVEGAGGAGGWGR